MALVKWDPWREMEGLFDRYSKAVGLPQSGGQELVRSGDWSPRVDIVESETEFLINAEIPDVKKEDIKVTVDNGALTLRGSKKQENEEKGKKFHRIERFYGSFSRSFKLPENVDEQKIEADFKDGMIHLHLPKTKASKSNAIQVRIK